MKIKTMLFCLQVTALLQGLQEKLGVLLNVPRWEGRRRQIRLQLQLPGGQSPCQQLELNSLELISPPQLQRSKWFWCLVTPATLEDDEA